MKKRALDRYHIGQLAFSLQGRDKDRVYVITGKTEDTIFVANGTKWTVEHPKKKNPFHLQVIGKPVIANEKLLIIEDTQICNEEIVQAIHAFENKRNYI